MTVPVDADDLVRLVTMPGTSGEPFDDYRRLRELTGGVHLSEQTRTVLVTGHAECQRVLGDKETFRVVDAAWMEARMPGWKPSDSQAQFFSSLFFRNPPEHTRLRAQLSRGFTSRRLRELGPMVDELAREAFDRLCRAAPGAPVDFVELIAAPLSTAALGGLLGVPVEDQSTCWKLLNEALPPPDPKATREARQAVMEQADKAAVTMSEYFRTLVAAKRAAPGPDLISAYLTEQSDAPERLSDTELAMALLPIFGAGVAALSDTLGNAVHTLLGHPDVLTRLHKGDFSADRTVAELFRYCGAYHNTRRYSTKDVELGGVLLPAGSVLMLLTAAANRDPEAYHDPEAFDIDRDEGGSLAFGGGIHHCLGAALSKLVAEAVCRELPRVPELRAAGSPEWRPSLQFFGPVRLPVSVGVPE
jgi:cytochrome P450